MRPAGLLATWRPKDWDCQLGIGVVTLEGRVNALDTISRQDQDPLIILELSQEYGDDCVSGQISVVSSSQKDVGFIEQQNAAPGLCQLQDLGEVFLHSLWFVSKFS